MPPSQCDQMLKQKVAQFISKSCQKVAKAAFSSKWWFSQSWGSFFKQICCPKPFQNRPIWSHCAQCFNRHRNCAFLGSPIEKRKDPSVVVVLTKSKQDSNAVTYSSSSRHQKVIYVYDYIRDLHLSVFSALSCLKKHKAFNFYCFCLCLRSCGP